MNHDKLNCNRDVDDTSTICTVSESIQLSLPESFDDTFSINGLSIAPDRYSKADVRLLHAQLLEFRRENEHLRSEKKIALNSLQNLNISQNFQDEQKKIKEIPIDKRTLLQTTKNLLYEKLSAIQIELEVAIEKAKNSSEIADQQREKALNFQTICEQRVSNLQESLNASNERRNELEDKCKDLQSTILDIQEKGRKFDILSSQNQNLEYDITHLRKLVDRKQKEIDDVKTEGTAVKSKNKDLERRVQSLELDKSFLQKEKYILVQRAEQSEQQDKRTQTALREATIRCDELMVQLTDANRNAQAESDRKAAVEIKRIRDECDSEIKRYRTQVETSYTRELSILKEAKEEATQQNKEARDQLQKIRSDLETMTAQKDESLHRLEKSLSDCRSDVKVKCLEASRLQLLNEKLEQNTKILQSEVDMLSDQVTVHKTEFKNLEHESLLQRKQFMDEIERKDEQLEMYYQSYFNRDKADQNLSSLQVSTQQTHFLDKAKQLENKNIELHKEMAQMKKNLDIQVQTSQEYNSKLSSAESEIQRLKNQIQANEEKMTMESGNSHHLKSLNHRVEEELINTKRERNKIAKDFAFLLEKYHQLVGQSVGIRATGTVESHHFVSQKNENSIGNNMRVWTYDVLQKKAIPVSSMNTMG